MSNQSQLPPRGPRGEVLQYDSRALAPYADAETDDEGFESGVSISEILEALWARKWWILLAALLGLVIALIYSLAQSPMYRATATIELNPPSVPVLSNGGETGEGMIVPATDRQFQATQLGILSSRALAERVIQDLDLTTTAATEQAKPSQKASPTALVGQIAAGLTVAPAVESRIIELSYVSEDPAQAARLANGFATSFIQLTLDRKYEATTSARRFLEERIKTVREDINDSERALVAYAKANGIILVSSGGKGEDDAGSSTLTGDSLGALNAALAVAQQKRIAAEQRFRQAGSLIAGGANAAGLRQQKAQLEAEYREKSTFLQDSFPEMARLKSRIAELEAQIGSENAKAAGALGGEYRAALAEEQALQSRVTQLSGNALTEREDAVQYNILKRELDTSRSLYDALLKRYNEVGVVQGIGTPQAAMVDRAEVPNAPYSPSTVRNSILGLLLGLFLGGALAVVYERFTNTVKSRDDVRDKLGISALGVIPVAEKEYEFLEQVLDTKSKMYDAYANLRTALQFSSSGGFPKVLLVTSSRPEEGKSSTSYSLGVQLANAGRKVLLIDADMRKPSFVAAEKSPTGLSTLLTTGSRLDGSIVRTTSTNLFLMPSGPVPPNPTIIIVPENLSTILDALREQFDHIILDAPPAGGFADAALLGSCCDGVLFTIESGKTRTSIARAALLGLQMAGVNLLGAVLTKASGRTIDYGYGNQYYYGSAKRREETSISVAVFGPAEDDGFGQAR